MAIAALAFVGRAQAASSAFRYDTKVTYTVLDESTTQVEEVYTVTNLTARQYLTELKLTTPSDKISDLRVAYADGSRIPTKVATKTDAGGFAVATQEIAMSFPRVNAGNGQRWIFVVSYKTAGLVETKGSAHTVYVPAIQDSDQRSSYDITVDVPQSFGAPHFKDSDKHLLVKNGDRQTYTFDEDDVAERSLALVFGDTTIYNFTFNAPLVNNSPVPRTFTVALPPDLVTQTSIVKSINPAPKTTRLDVDGNVLAEYTLGAYQKLTVVAKVEGQVRYRDYNLAASGTKKDIPAALVANYTRSTRYWPTDGAVGEAARGVVKQDAKVADNVRAVYDYVINKLTYNDDKLKFNVRQGAAKALANPSNAVCLEYADLMIAMLRSQGIPARMVVGYAYAGSLKASPGVEDSLHSWVEAYVPGIGWMTVDPTWGEKFDDFGRSDLDHYAFATWGKNDSAPGAVMLGGTDTGYQYENTQLSFSSVASQVPTSGNIAVTRYVVAPFIAVDRVHITAQSQIVSTGNRLVIGGRTIEIGSLAPGQDFTFRTLTLGLDWNSAKQVELQRDIAGKDTTIARTTATVSYLPMLMIAAIMIAIYLVYMVRLRSKRRASRVKKIYTDYNKKRDILDE
jgi:transglutaminase-like putative cysteine protease